MGRAIDSLWIVVRITDTTDSPDWAWLSDAVDEALACLDSGVEHKVIGTMICRNTHLDAKTIDDVIGRQLPTATMAVHGII